MEKKLTIILAVFIMVMGYAGAGICKGHAQNGDPSGTNYVDENGDGYCDNTGIPFIDKDGNGIHDGYLGGSIGFVDEDGDGICDKTGLPFVDEDGDGYCDNKNSLYRHRNKSEYGYGYGYVDEDGDGVCDGTGINFIDEDGDGICDNQAINRSLFDHEGQGRKHFKTLRADKYRSGNDNAPGSGLIENTSSSILDGTPFVYTGEVISVGSSGTGMVIETESGEIIINGIGPVWFWNCNDASRPVEGDVVEITGYTVDYDGVELNVASSVTVDGQTLVLRDSETGTPLWRGARSSCK